MTGETGQRKSDGNNEQSQNRTPGTGRQYGKTGGRAELQLAGQSFSLRNFADNFSLEALADAVRVTHAAGAKAYVTVNIFARNADLAPLAEHLAHLARIGPDAVIAADPAVVHLVRRCAPAMPIHLSTQANTTNAQAVQFWQTQGIERINLARELTLAEIETIVQSSDVQIETFVHGAMCMAYSGRCLLSNFMAGRPSNQGMCCQPCRFNYAVVEETRPGQYFPVAEDGRGAYIFNSRDLCLIDHLPALIKAGARSLKIEGRMKSIHYAATVVKIYREAIDRYYADPAGYCPAPHWRTELDKITTRGYCTGFLFPGGEAAAAQFQAPRPSAYPLAGKVTAVAGDDFLVVDVRNRIRLADKLELMGRHGPATPCRIHQITDLEGYGLAVANPGSRVKMRLDCSGEPLDILRRCPQ